MCVFVVPPSPLGIQGLHPLQTLPAFATNLHHHVGIRGASGASHREAEVRRRQPRGLQQRHGEHADGVRRAVVLDALVLGQVPGLGQVRDVDEDLAFFDEKMGGWQSPENGLTIPQYGDLNDLNFWPCIVGWCGMWDWRWCLLSGKTRKTIWKDHSFPSKMIHFPGGFSEQKWDGVAKRWWWWWVDHGWT